MKIFEMGFLRKASVITFVSGCAIGILRIVVGIISRIMGLDIPLVVDLIVYAQMMASLFIGGLLSFHQVKAFPDKRGILTYLEFLMRLSGYMMGAPLLILVPIFGFLYATGGDRSLSPYRMKKAFFKFKYPFLHVVEPSEMLHYDDVKDIDRDLALEVESVNFTFYFLHGFAIFCWYCAVLGAWAWYFLFYHFPWGIKCIRRMKSGETEVPEEVTEGLRMADSAAEKAKSLKDRISEQTSVFETEIRASDPVTQGQMPKPVHSEDDDLTHQPSTESEVSSTDECRSISEEQALPPIEHESVSIPCISGRVNLSKPKNPAIITSDTDRYDSAKQTPTASEQESITSQGISDHIDLPNPKNPYKMPCDEQSDAQTPSSKVSAHSIPRASMQQSPASPSPMNVNTHESPVVQKSSNTLLYIIIILLVLILVFGIVFGIIYIRNLKQQYQPDLTGLEAEVSTAEVLQTEAPVIQTEAPTVPPTELPTDPPTELPTDAPTEPKTSVIDCDKKGEINSKGANNIYSYTTDYVVNGGPQETVRMNLKNGWHVTAVKSCKAYGLTWYELYDTDDGDYYGWVDDGFLTFYSGNTPPPASKVTVYSLPNTYGEINSKGAKHIFSYTTDYVVNGGAQNTVRTNLENGWHVTAVNYCESMGIIWYELYDTDDGDYYGWVDETYLKFYWGD